MHIYTLSNKIKIKDQGAIEVALRLGFFCLFFDNVISCASTVVLVHTYGSLVLCHKLVVSCLSGWVHRLRGAAPVGDLGTAGVP